MVVGCLVVGQLRCVGQSGRVAGLCSRAAS